MTDLQPERVPTRISGAVYALKRALLCARFSVVRHTRRRQLASAESSDSDFFPRVLAEIRSPLYTALDPIERRLELGKVQNLRLACRAIDGTKLQTGETFSFWATVGKCTRRKGFVVGRELKEGCIMPGVGGGICQLSNALYEAVLDSGCEVVERHPHSKVVPGSAAARGRDATVAWNYVDLKFWVRQSLLIECRLTRSELVIRFLSDEKTVKTKARLPILEPRKTANSCATCEIGDCHHNLAATPGLAGTKTAFLVDEWWPEFDELVQGLAGPGTLLFMPLDPRFRKAQYGWTASKHGAVRSATISTLHHAHRMRRLSSQGAERQIALLRRAEEIAERYGRSLPTDVGHVVVSLNLLPYVWQDGFLGGRTFDVLMTREPMEVIHRILDEAFTLHPERDLLGDFRAPSHLLKSEMAALRAADRLITPHLNLAANDSRRILLAWRIPISQRPTPGRAIAFPGPTVGRKGAFELREALRGLPVELVPTGSALEGPGFWTEIKIRPPDPSCWLNGVGLVVHPALIEDKPRRLLQALAAGVPVIATKACGLPPSDLLRIVPANDPETLRDAIDEWLAKRSAPDVG